jgi:hypothetical protein
MAVAAGATTAIMEVASTKTKTKLMRRKEPPRPAKDSATC